MSFPLSQYDPEDLRNIILGILSRLNALEGGYVVVNEVSEIVEPETGTPPITNLIDVDWSINWQSVFIFDEFLTAVGDLGWHAPTDTGIVAHPVAAALAPDHPGLIKINTQAQDDGVFGYIVLDTAYVMPDAFDLMQFIGLCEDPSEADDGIVYGATAHFDGFEVDRSMEGIYFSFIFGETNWQAVTRDATSSTVTDTGVPLDSAKWFLFEIKRTDTGTFEFYINQVLVATHTTNITELPVSPNIGMSAQTIGSYGIYIDYFGMQLAPIEERWD